MLASIVKTCAAAAQVAAGATAGISSGMVATARDAGNLAECALKQDLDGVGKILENRVSSLVEGACSRIEAGIELIDEAGRCIQDPKRPFLTCANKRRMTQLSTVGLTAAAGLAFVDDDAAVTDSEPDPAGLSTGVMALPDPDDGTIRISDGMRSFVIEDGRFEGSDEELQMLARAGELSDTEHIEEPERSMAAHDLFLQSHGYDAVPAGYEVHHIVPLSEGGSDALGNMVILSEDDHDRITAQHADYYGWHRRT